MIKEALAYLASGFKPVSTVNPHEDVVAVGNGVSLQSLEKFRDRPDRVRGTVQLASSESFCDYINRFKDNETSVYIDVASGQFEAVLDHHGPGGPRWCEHRAVFNPKLSREWKAWAAAHEQWQKQIEFSLLIEQLLDTIASPEPNGVLKAALDFQSNENLVVASTQNLDNGAVRFNFQKDNVSKSVEFPHRITLHIPVFENEDAQDYEARIRYRVSGEGVLAFKFSFVQDPDTIQRDAMLELAEKTKDRTQGLDHYEGRVGNSKQAAL